MSTTVTEPAPTEKKSRFSKKSKSNETGIPDYSDFSAVKPKPNLAPRYVRDRRAADKTLRIVFWAMIGLFGLLVAGVIASLFFALGAKESLDDSLNTQKQVQNEVSRLGPIADYYDGLVQRQELASSTMQNDLDHPKLLEELYSAARGHVEVLSVTMAPSAPCPGPNPFETTPALGCINLTVSANNPAGAAAFVEALNSNPTLFSDAFTPTFASSEGTPANVTVNYSSNALSMRFVPADRRDEVKAAAEEAASRATTGATP